DVLFNRTGSGFDADTLEPVLRLNVLSRFVTGAGRPSAPVGLSRPVVFDVSAHAASSVGRLVTSVRSGVDRAPGRSDVPQRAPWVFGFRRVRRDSILLAAAPLTDTLRRDPAG